MVEQKRAGQAPEELFTYSLPKVEWGEEDLQFDKASVYTKEQTQAGDRDDENEYPVNILGNRSLEISVKGHSVSVSVDQQLILDQQPVDVSIGAGAWRLNRNITSRMRRMIFTTLFLKMST